MESFETYLESTTNTDPQTNDVRFQIIEFLKFNIWLFLLQLKALDILVNTAASCRDAGRFSTLHTRVILTQTPNALNSAFFKLQ